MTKPNFNNKYASGIRKPRRAIENAMLGISTITSGICLAGIAIQFISPGASFSSSPLLWALTMALGFSIAYVADFRINQWLGRFAITEIIAWMSGYFEIPMMRKINALIFGSIVAFGVFVSFVTSWDGSRITASMAPTVTPVMLSSVMQTERQMLNSELAPYRKSVSDIEGKIKAAVTARTSGELQRLSSQGNVWAKSEIQKISSDVERQYGKELAAAKTALGKAEEREQGRADKVLNDAEGRNKEVTAKNEERVSTIWNILTALGTLPLIFGMLLIVADCNETILAQKPKVYAKQANGGKDPNQRSSEDMEAEALYQNVNP
jgi:hypothetical protein